MPIRLGQLEIHAELNEISGPAGRQRLEPQAVAVLELLVAEPGHIWPRDELLERAWPGRVVSDATLTGVISRLRRTLDDAGVTDVRIETRSKRGYRLVHSNAPVRALTPRRSVPFLFAGLAVAILVVGLLPSVLPELFRPPPEPVDAVRLDFDITFPNGIRSEPVLWVADGKDGEIRLSGDHPLTLHVLPEFAGTGMLRLRIEAAGLSHWTGFEQVIGLGTESRFTLASRKPGARYEIRFVASLDPPPRFPQENPR